MTKKKKTTRKASSKSGKKISAKKTVKVKAKAKSKPKAKAKPKAKSTKKAAAKPKTKAKKTVKAKTKTKAKSKVKAKAKPKTKPKAAPKKKVKAPARKAPARIVKSVKEDVKLTPREKKVLKIKQKLLLQKDELLAEAETAMNVLPEQTVFPDLGDQASVETDRNFMLRLKGREQRLIKKIEEALERIESSTYGICDVCGEEIHIQRLEARPVTTMCIDCKTEQEEEEKLTGS